MSAQPVHGTTNPAAFGVLFVCLGNICRSPSAHAILESALRASSDPRAAQVRVDSAGLGDWHVGQLPDPRAIAEGERRGYTLVHRARRVSPSDLDRFDLILAMEPHQIGELRVRSSRANGPDQRAYDHARHRAQLALLRRWDPDPAAGDTVPDPYYGAEADFASMYDILETCIEPLLLDVLDRVR